MALHASLSQAASAPRQQLRAWQQHAHHTRRPRIVVAWAGVADASSNGHHHVQEVHPPRDPLATPQQLPLLGKRIIVTAPRQYAEKLSSKLLAAGARPLWVPGVAITALDPQLHAAHLAALDKELLALINGNQHGLTHVAFTSKNGIHAVLQRLAMLLEDRHGQDAGAAAADSPAGLSAAVDVLQSSGVRLCALGADGQVLLHAGLPVHVSPHEASTLGLVRELEERGEARGARLLCPVPLVTGGLTEPSVVPRFLAALQAAGAHPIRAEAYVTTLGGRPGECEVERRALEEGHVHAIAFSSTAEAQGLLQLMGGQQSVAAAVARHGVLLAAHGPYTAQGAAQVLGVPVPCVSKSFSSFDGLVHALEEAFAAKAAHQGATPEPPSPNPPPPSASTVVTSDGTTHAGKRAAARTVQPALSSR